MLSVITGICPTSSSICSDQNITKHISLWVSVHTFLSCRCLPLKCTGSISSPKLCRLFSHFLHTFLKCQMKALVFLHNAFLCLVYLIPRHTAAKSLPPPCDLQKGQRPLWSTYSCIYFLGEGTTASQSCGTRVPALLPLPQPREQHQARASSLSLWTCGRRMHCPCMLKGSGCGCAHRAALRKARKLICQSPVHLEEVLPACRQFTKKEGKERKLLN